MGSVNAGAVLEDEIITNPAWLMVGRAAVAALEQLVPTTPTIVGSEATLVAAV